MNPMSKAASFSGSTFSPGVAGRRGLRLAPLVLLCAITGCANLETLAPSVAKLKGDHSSLEAGRRIYLGQCATCHVAEPIHDYPASRWPGILDDMVPKTKLDPSQERDVRAYVAAVCRQN